MNRILKSTLLLALLFSFPHLHAAKKPFETGRIITVEKEFHTRVLYYLVNTPITQDDPYYELSLQLGDTVLWTEYTPRHAAEALPEGWKENSEVEMTVTDKHHVSVRQGDGIELQLVITKRTPATEQLANPKPALLKK